MPDEEKVTVVTEPEHFPEAAVQKKYKTVVCKKCGTEYSSLYKECPHCGYSHTREVSKLIACGLCIAGLIVTCVVNSMSIAKLKGEVETLKADLISTKNTIVEMGGNSASGGEATVDLNDLQYYNDQLITEDTDLEELPEDYLLYALQDDCPYCAEANEFVYSFLANGYPDYIPVYFITPQSNESMFFEYLNCTDTPTLYRMSKAEIKETFVGVDGVFEGFDGLVNEANAAYDASIAQGEETVEPEANK